MKIYHNPRCRKSQETLKLIENAGIHPEVILYLEDKPTKKDLESILKKLGIKAEALIRKGETVFKENFKGLEKSEKEWIEIMVQYPKLIERPIVLKGKKAVIGRPPENVLELL